MHSIVSQTMSDERDEMDGAFAWASDCKSRYEVILHSKNGDRCVIPKYRMDLLCHHAEITRKTLYEIISSRSGEVREALGDSCFNLDDLSKIEISDKKGELKDSIRGMVDESVRKYMKEKGL